MFWFSVTTTVLSLFTIPFDWAGETARHVGSLVHRYLERIGGEGLGIEIRGVARLAGVASGCSWGCRGWGRWGGLPEQAALHGRLGHERKLLLGFRGHGRSDLS